MRGVWLVMTAGVLASIPPAASAQATGNDWRVTVTPYVWGKALEGKVGGAGLSSPIDIPLSETMETAESVFMGEVAVQGPRWGAYLDYQATESLKQESAAGFPLEATIGLRSFTGAVHYTAHEERLGGDTVHGEPRLFSIRPLVGARWSRARADLTVPTVIEIGKQAEWTDVIVGLRTEADISSRWTAFGHLDAGGFDPGDRFSLSAQAHLGYRSRLLSRPVVYRVGYALLFQEYSQDDFTGDRFVFNMTSHGPVAGVSITF